MKFTRERLVDRSCVQCCCAAAVGLTVLLTAAVAMSQQGASTMSATSMPSIKVYRAQWSLARKLETKAYQTKSPADYQAAADALEVCAREDPQDVSLQRSLGFLYLEPLHEPEKAYPYLEAVYRMTPNAPGWGEMLARAAEQTGRTDRAIEVLRDTAKRHPDDPWCRLTLAKLLEKLGRYQEAEQAYLDALRVAPDDQWVNLGYAQFLKARGRYSEARKIAKRVLTKYPKSAAALELLGDISRANWNLTEAQTEYTQAMLLDPSYYGPKTGLNEIRLSREDQVSTKYFFFKGTDDYYQAGLFNSLSVPVSDHVSVTGNFNTGWFNNHNTDFGDITRFQESLEVQDRVDSTLSLQGGASGFEVKAKDEAGFDFGATWKPTQKEWLYASYQFNAPVDDSIATVAQGVTQDVIGGAAGYQFTNELSAKVSASHAFYSDGNGRNFVHIEPDYLLWSKMQLYLGAEYQVIDYQRSTSAYSSPHWYETYGPLIELQPNITSWLAVHARVEFPFIPDSSQFGTTISVGPMLHIADRLEATAEYLYYSVPGTFTNYSGSGFRATLSYRF